MINLSSATRPSPPTRPFYPALDGLRTLAFLLVFSFHFIRPISNSEIFRWGWMGVDLFFALSGFLITGILFDSLQQPDYFRNFYIRRALRIFPLFYSFWLLLLLLTPVVHIYWHHYLLAMAFHVGNFFIPGGHLHHLDASLIIYRVRLHHGRHALLINHFWSLCIEEQFYLVWPAILWFLRSRRALLRLCVVLFVALPLLRWFYLLQRPEMLPLGTLYFNTFARLDSLLAGAVTALWLRGPVRPARTTRRAALAMIFGAPLVLGLLLRVEASPRALPIFDPVVSTVGYNLIAITAVGILLLALDPSSRVGVLLRLRPLCFLGRISYGMYFIHELLFAPMEPLIPILQAHHLAWLFPILAFAGTFVLSWLSFRYLESPFLRLKPRLAPRPGAIDDPSFDGTSIVAEREQLSR